MNNNTNNTAAPALAAGLTHTSTLTVTDNLTAQVMGSGDMPVLATPAMIALMENAAMLAVAPALQQGDTTVGTLMNATHDRPSPVGATVEATATLTAVEGRKLTFDIQAHDAQGQLIGTATHHRVIVTRDRFLSRVK